MNEQHSSIKIFGLLIGVIMFAYVINLATDQYYAGVAALKNPSTLQAAASTMVLSEESAEVLGRDDEDDRNDGDDAQDSGATEEIVAEEIAMEGAAQKAQDSTDTLVAEMTALAVAEESVASSETGDETVAEAAPEEGVNAGIGKTGEEIAEHVDLAFVSTAITKGACSACHMIPGIDGAVGEIAPSLATIGIDAATRVEGLDAEAYIRQSILEPNAFIAPECPTYSCAEGVMPLGLANRMTVQELDSIVSYLLTLDEEVEPSIQQASMESESAESISESHESSFDYNALSNIVTKGTCGACHVIPNVGSAMGLVGPDLSTIGRDAGTRIDGYTAEAYLRESIHEPNAFIAPDCPTGSCTSGIMPAGLADHLSTEEFDMLITYLLSLN